MQVTGAMTGEREEEKLTARADEGHPPSIRRFSLRFEATLHRFFVPRVYTGWGKAAADPGRGNDVRCGPVVEAEPHRLGSAAPARSATSRGPAQRRGEEAEAEEQEPTLSWGRRAAEQGPTIWNGGRRSNMDATAIWTEAGGGATADVDLGWRRAGKQRRCCRERRGAARVRRKKR